MNTKGMKFLAVLAVLAMVFAAIAVISLADDSDAAYEEGGKYAIEVQGPLNFSATNDDVGTGVSNKILGNNILVSYDAASKTYTVTGTLAKQDLTDTTTAFYQMYTSNATTTKEYTHGIVFGITATSSTKVTFTGDKTYDYGDHFAAAADTCLIYVKSQGISTVKITGGTYAGEYTIDLTGVTLSSTETTGNGYVALAGTNALQSVFTTGTALSGTDGGSGTWSLTREGDVSTLIFTNYNGKEQFMLGPNVGNMKVVFSGTNTINVALSDHKTVYGGSRIETIALGIQAGTTFSIEAANSSSSLKIVATDSGLVSPASKTYYALGEAATTTIGSSSASVITKIDATGPWSAIRVNADATIQNSEIKAAGGEKALNFLNLTVKKSTVDAKMDKDFYNGIGTDKRFGTKIEGTLTIDGDSTLTTQGLNLVADVGANLANSGTVVVSGGYSPQKVGYVDGLMYEGTTTLLTAYDYAAGKGKIQVTSDAAIKGYVKVVNSSGKASEHESKIIPDAATAEVITAAIEAINASEAKEVEVAINTTSGDVTIATPIVASETKTVNLVVSGANKVNADVVIDDKTVKLTNITGSVAITKGSIKIYGDPWTAGTITLNDGDVAKVSGTVGAVTFNYDGPASGKATILVEKDTTLTITTSLTINSANISMEIEGTVTADAVGKDLINDTSKVVIKDGAVVEKIDITGTGAIEVYSGSDINSIGSITNWDKVTGKDAASGTWKVNAGKTELTLNNYNGTYNFLNFENTLTAIKLTGTNVVSYAFPATYANAGAFNLFGNASITSITTTTSGSLQIDVDVSKVAGDKLFTPVAKVFTVISGTTVDINGVNIVINVTGTNGDWTADQKKAVNIIGITSTTFNTYNASITMDLLSSTTAVGVIGLNASDVVTIGTGNIDIKVGGTALKSDAAVTISNTTSVSLVGKSKGISTTSDALTIRSIPSVTISGGITTGTGVLGALTVQESNVNVAGTTTVLSINETNTSDVKFTGKLTIGAVTLTQNSSLTMKDAIINGVITNGGNIKTTGNVIINGDSSAAGNDENSTFVNDGTIALFGKIANKGQFTNNGSLTVFADAIALVANHIIVSEDLPADATKARLGDIEITAISINADGTATVKATLAFQFKAGDAFVGVGLDKFEGTLTPSQVDAGFTLVLSNGSANVNVQYDASKAGYVVGESYTITVSGAIKDAGDNLRYLEANKTGTGAATITAHTIDGLMTPSNAAFTATAGKITSTGSFIIYSPVTATIGTEFEGDLVADIATKLNINGKFTGNITSNGASEVSVTEVTKGTITAKGDVSMAGTLTGDIISDGKVTVTAAGTMTGDITAKDDVSIGKKQIGNITVNSNDKKLTVNGEVDGILTYNSAYKATKDATEATTYTATMAIKGTGNFVINLAAGADATASTEVIPGSFTFQSMAVVEDKSTEMTLTAGKLGVPADFIVPVGYSVVIEAGTTIEVAKTATLNVEKSALKVSKDATANFETGTGIAVTYGKVSFVMSFTIDGGAYTIYSNVAYALSNCDENSELTVGKSDTITANVDVKKGVNIIVDSVTLDFDKYALTMADDAKITLVGTGKVVFKATGDNKAGLPAEDEYVYYTVSGSIVYDDANVVILDAVRFTAESQLVGVASTETVPSKISATLLYNEGTATIAAGNGTGSITIDNLSYALTKADEAALPTPILTLVSGTFEIAEGAVFDAIVINDDFGIVQYALEDAEYVVKETVQLPTYVSVEGTLNLLGSTIVKGVYAGDGKVTLAATKTLTLAAGDMKEVNVNKNAAPSVTVEIVDTTEDENGYVLVLVSPRLTNAEAGTIVLTAEKFKDADVMTITGKIGIGIITSNNDAYLKAVEIDKEVAITADTTYVIGADSTSKGYLATKEIFMKVGAAASEYQTLNYEVTFEKEGYTVYTYFATVDFDEISDITIAKSGNLNVFAGVAAGAKLDLSGKDVNISVAEDEVLTVNVILIVGTPATTLGSGGSSMVGKFIIADGVYLVAYADVDLSEAEIVDDADDEARSSILDIEGVTYATLFAGNANVEAVKLAKADKALTPVIVGYNFTSWNNYDGDVNSYIGETNAYAGSKAVLVSVTVKFAEGVTYYKDGVEFAIYDTPTKVDYGSVFTAKINNTAKYEGTPLINGQNSFVVDGDATLTVTGVGPIPEPAPTGMSLTEILLIVLVVLIAIMVVIIALRLNRS